MIIRSTGSASRSASGSASGTASRSASGTASGSASRTASGSASGPASGYVRSGAPSVIRLILAGLVDQEHQDDEQGKEEDEAKIGRQAGIAQVLVIAPALDIEQLPGRQVQPALANHQDAGDERQDDDDQQQDQRAQVLAEVCPEGGLWLLLFNLVLQGCQAVFQLLYTALESQFVFGLWFRLRGLVCVHGGLGESIALKDGRRRTGNGPETGDGPVRKGVSFWMSV